jgi:GNAT superfamily N-acetyltransferase
LNPGKRICNPRRNRSDIRAATVPAGSCISTRLTQHTYDESRIALNMVHVKGPGWMPSEAYYQCRYATLRQPLGFERGAELLEDDSDAIHAYVKDEHEDIVCVGRAHLIPEESDGSQSDFPGANGPKTPAFSPLLEPGNRPAIQIRQMGTLRTSRRRGLAAKVLEALEKNTKETFSAKIGLLQAREEAIPFYQAAGWTVIDQPYSIPNVGLHRSMMKVL